MQQPSLNFIVAQFKLMLIFAILAFFIVLILNFANHFLIAELLAFLLPFATFSSSFAELPNSLAELPVNTIAILIERAIASVPSTFELLLASLSVNVGEESIFISFSVK